MSDPENCPGCGSTIIVKDKQGTNLCLSCGRPFSDEEAS